MHHSKLFLAKMHSSFLKGSMKVSLTFLVVCKFKSTSFFFSGDDKSILSYTKGEGADLSRSRDNPEGTEPPPDQTGAQHTRLDFLEQTTYCDQIVGGRD